MTSRIPPRALDPAGATAGQVPVIDPTGEFVEWDDAAGGGATDLDGLTDVDTSTTPPTDNQGLRFDAASGLWVPGATTPSTHTHAAADTTTGTFDAARLPVAASGESSATKVVRADDARLSDARTPTTHTHTRAQITDAGTAIARNVPATGDAAAGEVVLGSDTRLSDARTPTAHTHAATAITYAGSTNLSATNVEAALDELDAEKAGTGTVITMTPTHADMTGIMRATRIGPLVYMFGYIDVDVDIGVNYADTGMYLPAELRPTGDFITQPAPYHGNASGATYRYQIRQSDGAIRFQQSGVDPTFASVTSFWQGA